jgi:protein TonB
MLPKKTKKADLENKRVIFFQIGLLISLAVALLAFEWTSGEPGKSLILRPDGEEPDEETLLNTFREKEITPEIKPLDYFTFDIKDNDADLIDEAIEIDVEIDPWDDFDIPDIQENPDDDIPFINVGEMPTFMDGDLSNFVKYIQSTVIYQKDAIDMQIQGKVYASFVVNKEGHVENIRIVKGVDPLLDNEVVKALEASPRWKPGKQRDVPVKVIFTIPIVFKINY